MRITESLSIENDRRGYQEVCSDCEACGLKQHGLTRSDCILFFFIYLIYFRGGVALNAPSKTTRSYAGGEYDDEIRFI